VYAIDYQPIVLMETFFMQNKSNKKLDRFEIIAVLKALGINTKVKPRNNWIDILSPLREEKNPSFSINLESGAFIDRTTDEKGSIIDLIKRINGTESDKAVADFLDMVLNRDRTDRKRKSGISIQQLKKENSQLIDTNADSIKKIANERSDINLKALDDLDLHSNAPFFDTIEEYDGLTRNTLDKFGCKFLTKHGQLDLAMIYPTGVELYSRNEENEKQVIQMSGSSPNDSFFGVEHIPDTDSTTLLITKSPRECMLAWQEFSPECDVISVCGGEKPSLSHNQAQIIKELAQKYDTVIVVFDQDTEEAKSIAEAFSVEVKKVIEPNVELKKINIHDLSEGKAKDIADLYRTKSPAFPNLLESAEVVKVKGKDSLLTTDEVIWNTKGAIEKSLLLEKLQERGLFKRYIADEDRNYMVKDNVIVPINESQLTDFVNEMIQNIPDEVLDRDTRVKVMSSLITTNMGQLLTNAPKKEDLGLHQDQRNDCYLFFKDKCIRVTKDSVQDISYEDLDGLIWEQDQAERLAPVEVNSEKSEFEVFCELVTGENSDRKASLMSAIGYLLHRYKNKANSKAIIFTDQEIGMANTSNGGTGKTLIAKAIGHLRPLHEMSGISLNSKDKFMFNDFQEYYRLILIDDVGEKFIFEDLFTVITGNMPIRRLHKNRFSVPFEQAPKFILTTNDPLSGSGESHKRRQFIVEFASFFDSQKNPVDYFGHMLFDDWDEKEWARFDAFMIQCIQLFLKDGLVEASVNYEKRKAINETSLQFFNWAELYLELELEYEQRELFRGHSEVGIENYPGMKKPKNKNGESFPSYSMHDPGGMGENQIRTFKRSLELYASYKGWKIQERESNGNTFIWFTKRKSDL